MKRKCPLCNKEKDLNIGIGGIGLVCFDCGMKRLKHQKETIDWINCLALDISKERGISFDSAEKYVLNILAETVMEEVKKDKS